MPKKSFFCKVLIKKKKERKGIKTPLEYKYKKRSESVIPGSMVEVNCIDKNRKNGFKRGLGIQEIRSRQQGGWERNYIRKSHIPFARYYPRYSNPIDFCVFRSVRMDRNNHPRG